MHYTTLGRTGLRVSRVGLGCGGPSRLGQSYGGTDEGSARVIERALELGINFFDTAESYGTEALLGAALAQSASGREALVSSKKGVWHSAEKRFCTAAEMLEGLEQSLWRLDRERIDVYHLHGLELPHVEYALAEIVPVLQAARAQGKIGYLAVSEAFMSDTRHRALTRLLDEDAFDVMMVGFNLLNPSARRLLFPETRRRGIGTLIMFAVRRALTSEVRLREVLDGLIERGEIPAERIERERPLGFLGDVRDAAYRFCMHEPGVDVVLTGTGKVEHLEQNVKSLLDVPLSPSISSELERSFGHLESISGH